MIPVPLSETWGAAYFQTIVVLLVFACGLPALMVQLTTPPEVMRVVSRQGIWVFGGTLFMMFLYATLAIAFLWYLTPSKSIADSTAALDARIAACAITGLLLVTNLFWWAQISRNLQTVLYRRISRKVIKGVKKHGRIDERSLGDITYLGINASSTAERSACVAAIEQVGKASLVRDDYIGSSLGGVVDSLRSLALAALTKGDLDAFGDSTESIKSLLQQANLLGFDSPDAGLLQRAAGRFGAEAARHKLDSFAILLLQELSDPARILEVGIAAVEGQSFIVSLAALNQLGRIVQEHPHEMLALYAHLWHEAKSSRSRICSDIAIRAAEIGKDPAELLREAEIEFADRGEFQTADLLLILHQEWPAP